MRFAFHLTLCCAILGACLSSQTALAQNDEAPSSVDVESVVGLLELLIEVDPASAAESLDVLVQGVQNGTLSDDQLAGLKKRVGPMIAEAVTQEKSPLHRPALLLATSWGNDQAAEKARATIADASKPLELRSALLQALSTAGDPQLQGLAAKLISQAEAAPQLAAAAIDALSIQSTAEAVDPVLNHYPQLSAELQAKAIEMLTSRPVWSMRLLEQIGTGKIPNNALNANQVAKLQGSGNEKLTELVLKHWGRVRTERNPERERVVADMRSFLSHSEGNAVRGREVFHKVCGQCHQIFGRGHKVGPDITGNGRSSFEQLLSNVFDPSLVIGEAYQARTVLTVEGKIITGLLAEESDRQVVLNTQGGKTETIPTEDIEAMRISQLSLMPEGLEKQLKPQELADLFAFVTLTAEPEDASAARIPGSPDFAGE